MERKKGVTISILGAGWLGVPLALALSARGYKVKGSTTKPEKCAELEALGIQAYHLMLNGSQMTLGANADAFFDCDILYLNMPPGRKNQNVAQEFPERIKTAMLLAQERDVPYAVFVSSTGVFGDHQSLVTEEDIPEPTTTSGQALLTVERYLSLLNKPRTTILRLGGLIGQTRHPGRFLSGKTNLKNGNLPVNLTHLDDAISASIAVIDKQKWDDCFHVVAEKHPMRREYYPEMAKNIQEPPPTFLPDDRIGGKVVSSEKIKRELGFRFLHPDPTRL